MAHHISFEEAGPLRHDQAKEAKKYFKDEFGLFMSYAIEVRTFSERLYNNSKEERHRKEAERISLLAVSLKLNRTWVKHLNGKYNKKGEKLIDKASAVVASILVGHEKDFLKIDPVHLTVCKNVKLRILLASIVKELGL